MKKKELICKKCGVIAFPSLEVRGKHIRANCSSCGSYIKFLPQEGEYIFYFGKHKGKTLEEVAREECTYIEWCLKNYEGKKRIKLRKAVNN